MSDVRKNRILEDIDAATSPLRMSPTEALEFLEDLASDLEGRIDGLKSDIDNSDMDED